MGWPKTGRRAIRGSSEGRSGRGVPWRPEASAARTILALTSGACRQFRNGSRPPDLAVLAQLRLATGLANPRSRAARDALPGRPRKICRVASSRGPPRPRANLDPQLPGSRGPRAGKRLASGIRADISALRVTGRFRGYSSKDPAELLGGQSRERYRCAAYILERSTSFRLEPPEFPGIVGCRSSFSPSRRKTKNRRAATFRSPCGRRMAARRHLTGWFDC